MKLVCSRQILATALATVSGVVPTRTTKDILKNIKLIVNNGVATLIGTDQEVGIRYQMPEIQSSSPGEVLLPTQRVTAILRELQDSEALRVPRGFRLDRVLRSRALPRVRLVRGRHEHRVRGDDGRH